MGIASRLFPSIMSRSVRHAVSRGPLFESLEGRLLMSVEMANWSDSFVDSIGVNIKGPGYGYLYGDKTQLTADLQDIGIRNIRGNLTALSGGVTTNIATNVPMKALLMLDVQDHKHHTDQEYTDMFTTQLGNFKRDYAGHADRILGLEGPNELDGTPYDDQFYNDIPTINRIAYQLIHQDSFFNGIPYIGCSFSNRSSYQYQEDNSHGIGDQSQGLYADAANTHAYVMGFSPEVSAKYSSAQLSRGTETYGLPVWMPEIGYSTTTGTNGLTENEQARYTLRTFLDNYNQGISRTFWHELGDADEGGWANFLGLIKRDKTYKPSATALKNMIGVLSDPNGGTSYTAGGLDYTWGTSTPTDIQHTLLQKANGKFELVLWRGIGFTGDAPAPSESVTLNFATGVNSSATQYNPLSSATGSSVTISGNQLTLNITDEVTIIEITPSSRPSAAPAAPTGVTVTSPNNASTFAKVSWTASAGADGYVIERKGTDNVWTPVGKTTTATTYTDSGLIPNRTYTYRVRAANRAGGNISAAVAYTPPAGKLAIIPMDTNTMFDSGNITISVNNGANFYCSSPTVATTPGGGQNSYIVYKQPGMTSFQATIDGDLWELQANHFSADISTDGVNWTTVTLDNGPSGPVANNDVAYGGLTGDVNGRPSVWFLSPKNPLPVGTNYVRFNLNSHDTYKYSAFALAKIWYTDQTTMVTESSSAPTNYVIGQPTGGGAITGGKDYSDNAGPPAQTFTTGSTGFNLGAITVKGGGSDGNLSPAANWHVTISQVVNGQLKVLSTQTTPGFAPTSSSDYLTFTLGTPVTLAANTQYAYSIYADGQGVNGSWFYYAFAKSSSDVYSGGQAIQQGSTAIKTAAVGSTDSITQAQSADRVFFLSAAGTGTQAAAKLTGSTIGTTGSYSTGQTNIYTASDGANAVFEGNFNTYFDPPATSTQGNQWVGLDLGSPKVITAVKVAARASFGSRLAGSQIQVSTDGTNWTTAYTIGSSVASGQFTTFNINLQSAYRYVRLIGATDQWFNVAEMEVWGY